MIGACRGLSARRLAPFLAALCVSACAKSDAQWTAELAEADPFVRALAAIALSRQNPQLGRLALPVLLETVDRVELGLRRPSQVALAEIAPGVVDGLLANLVQDEFMTADRKQAVIAALCAAGPRAVPAVVAAIRGSGRENAGELGVVLVRAGGPAVRPLIELLEDAPDPRLCGHAAWLLGQIGPPARDAVPALREKLAHPDASVVRGAREAIARIERSPADAPLRGPDRGR